LLLRQIAESMSVNNVKYVARMATNILKDPPAELSNIDAYKRDLLSATENAIRTSVTTFDLNKVKNILRAEYSKRRAKYEEMIVEHKLCFELTDDVDCELACAMLYDWIYKCPTYISYFNSIFPRLRRRSFDLRRRPEDVMRMYACFTIAFGASDGEGAFRALRTASRH
jgi:hypothetical protein